MNSKDQVLSLHVDSMAQLLHVPKGERVWRMNPEHPELAYGKVPVRLVPISQEWKASVILKQDLISLALSKGVLWGHRHAEAIKHHPRRDTLLTTKARREGCCIPFLGTSWEDENGNECVTALMVSKEGTWCLIFPRLDGLLLEQCTNLVSLADVNQNRRSASAIGRAVMPISEK